MCGANDATRPDDNNGTELLWPRLPDRLNRCGNARFKVFCGGGSWHHWISVEMSPKVKPVSNGAARPPNRDRLLSPRRLFSGILDGPLDNRRGLNAHHCRTSLIEMEGILEKVSMLGHKSMLIIDANSLRFDESSSDGIPRFNAGIRGAVRCLRSDRGNRSPDELAVTWERPNGLKKNAEAGLELRFCIAPAVQAVGEVNYS